MIALLLLALSASSDTVVTPVRPFATTLATGMALQVGQTGGAWLDLGLQLAYQPIFVQGDIGIHIFPSVDPGISMAPGQRMPDAGSLRTTLYVGKEWRGEDSWISFGLGWYVQEFDTLATIRDKRTVYLDDSTGRRPSWSGDYMNGGPETIGWVWNVALWGSGPLAFAEWGYGSRARAIVVKAEICQHPQIGVTLRFRIL